jgi:hypothetical protein
MYERNAQPSNQSRTHVKKNTSLTFTLSLSIALYMLVHSVEPRSQTQLRVATPRVKP